LRILHSRIRASAVLAVLLATLGCSRSSTSYPLGKLAVRVLDAYNAPLRGAAADLYKLTPRGKLYWRASSTDSLGTAVFGAKNGGVIEGDYVVHVSFITWQDLAPGETNDRPVTVKAGHDTVITFRVVPRLPRRH
jgi:hypothetical protein